jgi:hypothetical protein
MDTELRQVVGRFGFGFFVGVYPQGDQTVGVLIMFGGLAQIVYSFGVSHE